MRDVKSPMKAWCWGMLMGLLALLLVACEAPPMRSDLSSAEKLQGGVALVGITQEPDFLDPHLAVAAGTKEILHNVFEGLMRMDASGHFHPALAKDYAVEAEGKALSFALRDDVFFHHGRRMDHRDVLYSLRRAAGLDTGTPLVPALAGVTEISFDATRERLIIRQAEPQLDLLAALTVAIVPKDVPDLSKEPVGTGPFRLNSYLPQEQLRLDRFEDYWGKKAYLDGLIFKIYGSQDAAYMELLAAQIDLFPYLTHEKAEGLKDHYALVKGSANMVQLLAMNHAKPPLDQQKVRAAIEAAVDRQQIIDLVMGGEGRALTTGMSPAMADFYNENLPVREGADLSKAKRLLKEAGIQELSLELKVPANYTIHVDTARILQAQLAKVGVELRLVPLDWGTWIASVYQGGDYALTVIALTFDFSPSDVLDRYQADSADNFIHFDHADYDRLAKDAREALDLNERQDLYAQMQDILHREVASVFIQDPMNITAVRKGLSGYIQYPAYILALADLAFTDQEALERSLDR